MKVFKQIKISLVVLLGVLIGAQSVLASEVVNADNFSGEKIKLNHLDHLPAEETLEKRTEFFEWVDGLSDEELDELLGKPDDEFARTVARGGSLLDEVYDAQKRIINEHKNAIATASNARKGNFAEMSVDVNLTEKKYEYLHRRLQDIDAPNHKGIDGVWKKDGQYYIEETKFGDIPLNQPNSATNLPRQMSEDWITQNDYQRLREAVGDEIAEDIISKGYTRIVGNVQSNGTITYKKILNSEATEFELFNP